MNWLFRRYSIPIFWWIVCIIIYLWIILNEKCRKIDPIVKIMLKMKGKYEILWSIKLKGIDIFNKP